MLLNDLDNFPQDVLLDFVKPHPIGRVRVRVRVYKKSSEEGENSLKFTINV